MKHIKTHTDKTVLISLPIEELQTVITECVNSCLKNDKQIKAPSPPPDFKYIPIQEIFKKKICSKPTFYKHLKRGDFKLYKFGNKSFVDMNEFLSSFSKVELNNKKGENAI